MKPRLLDLFCGAGGAAMGYSRAGFEVVGVDIAPQPHYPFEFHQADALTFPLEGFDAIHASPPCQAYSAGRHMWKGRLPDERHPDLVGTTRALLLATGVPYVIENVEGAPLNAGPPSLFSPLSGVTLCGSMFGVRTSQYQLRRHRLFESNRPLPRPSCRHSHLPTVGFYGDHARIRSRVDGHKDRGTDILGARKMQLATDLMGIDWMTWPEIKEAIPPAYTQWIGEHLMAAVEVAA